MAPKDFVKYKVIFRKVAASRLAAATPLHSFEEVKALAAEVGGWWKEEMGGCV